MIRCIRIHVQIHESKLPVNEYPRQDDQIGVCIFFDSVHGCVSAYFRADFDFTSPSARLINWGNGRKYSILALTDIRDPASRSPSPAMGDLSN